MTNDSQTFTGLNQLSRGAYREVPNAVDSNLQALPVPSQVPFVQPVDTRVSGIDPRNSKLYQLGSALGAINVSGSGIAKRLQQQNAAKQEIKRAENYQQGLLEASKRAASSRDLYDDLSKNGWVPKSDNPWYNLGYQHAVSNELATQYKSELQTQRRQNPLKDPGELQGEVKSRYLGMLRDFNPEMVNRYFVESSQKADAEDVAGYNKFKDEDFIGQVKTSAGNRLLTTVQSALEGGKPLADIQAESLKSVEETLKVNYATGLPVQETAETLLDTLISTSQGALGPDGKPAPLATRLGILDTARKIQLPNNGQFLLGNPELNKKFVTAREAIVKQEIEIEKTELEVTKLKRDEATVTAVSKMAEDQLAGQLKPATEYVTPGVDIAEVNRAYRNYNEVTVSQPTGVVNSFEKTLQNHIFAGSPPDAVFSVIDTGIDTGYITPQRGYELKDDVVRRQKTLQDASRPRSYDQSQITALTGRIQMPPLKASQAKFVDKSYGYSTAGQAKSQVEADLRSKYTTLLKQDADSFVKNNPQFTQPQLNDYLRERWTRVHEPRLERDRTDIRNRTGDYPKIMKRSTAAEYKAPPAPKTKPYLVSKAAWEQAVTQFRGKKGPLYKDFLTSLERNGKLNEADARWKLYLSPTGPGFTPLLRGYQKHGWATWQDKK